jgi:hypothetical protein
MRSRMGKKKREKERERKRMRERERERERESAGKQADRLSFSFSCMGVRADLGGDKALQLVNRVCAHRKQRIRKLPRDLVELVLSRTSGLAGARKG